MASTVVGAYNEGLGAEPPAGSKGRVPGRRLGGKALLKLKHFGFWTFNGNHKFAHFFAVWKCKEIRYLCYFCKKSQVAMKLGKEGWSKTGELCPSPPGAQLGLKTATDNVCSGWCYKVMIDDDRAVLMQGHVHRVH